MQWSRIKIVSSYGSNFFNFWYNNIPLRWLSNTSLTGQFDYSYARIHQRIVEEIVVEIHHCRRHFFFRTFFFDTVVINNLPGTFHFLTEPGIFCCVQQFWRVYTTYLVLDCTNKHPIEWEWRKVDIYIKNCSIEWKWLKVWCCYH